MTRNPACLNRKAAAEGMVLLKNDEGVLPFKPETTVAVFGRGQVDFMKGGHGSAEVFSEYSRNLQDGLLEKEAGRKVRLCRPLLELYSKNSQLVLTDELIERAASEAHVAIIVISRISGEGSDRKSEKGDFYLSDDEVDTIRRIQHSRFETIVIVLNVGAVIESKWIYDYSKIKAVLLTWLPGMEGGLAAADILCGDVNPSGKLTDTFASCYEAYPSSKTFKQDDVLQCYEEDIFVGYRYFETIPRACDEVVFPFGHGLSYTTFCMTEIRFSLVGKNGIVQVTVENTGRVEGREVIQVYLNAPKGVLGKPAIQLMAYQKTNPLKPGEKQALRCAFAIEDMASFDDTGVTGHPFAYVLEKGLYTILAGNSSRTLSAAGAHHVTELTVVKPLQARWKPMLKMRLRQDGTLTDSAALDVVIPLEKAGDDRPHGALQKDRPVMLADVAAGQATLAEFMVQLSDADLIGISQAQPPAFPRGTAGVGNLKKYGIPNPQTADGPAGLRRTVPSTAWPCATLIGCTWDEALQYEIGKAIGTEGLAAGVDIWLAPGINIHRDPLCGRNFEYFSEDPLISGKSGAAIIRGAQSAGLVATCKHFAANNREFNRLNSNSLVSERALREIYLKGFEIVVRESQPGCIMTSYNSINGQKTSTNGQLLTGILREEWGFTGAVMTDWRNSSHLWEEIIAGNNIKMPFGYPDEIALALEMVNCGKLTRNELEASVKPVLELVMKTSKFRNQDYGVSHTICRDKPTRIKAVEITGTSYTFTGSGPCLDEDGGRNLTCLNKDQRGNDTYLIYNLHIEHAGAYRLTARMASAYHEPVLEFQLDGGVLARLCQEPFENSQDEAVWQQWKTLGPVGIALPEGDHVLNVVVRTEDEKQKISLNWIELKPE